MVTAARFPHQFQISGDLPPFGFGADAPVPMGGGVSAVVDIAAPQKPIVLAVGHDQLPKSFRFFHGSPHHLIPLHAVAIVGKSRHVRGHGIHIRKDLSLFSDGDGAVGYHLYDGIPADDVQLCLQVRQIVGTGVQIRHGAYGGVPAPRRGTAAARNGFLIGKTRLAQVHMHIGEAGKYGISVAGDLLCQGSIGGAGEKDTITNGNGLFPDLPVSIHIGIGELIAHTNSFYKQKVALRQGAQQ